MIFGIKLFNKQLNDNFPKNDKIKDNGKINIIKNSKKGSNKNKNPSNNQISALKIIKKNPTFLVNNWPNSKNNLINYPPKKVNIFNINSNNNNNNCKNDSKIQEKYLIQKIFNENNIKIVKGLKKRSNSSYYKKKKILLNLNNVKNDSEKNNNQSNIEGFEKSKSNLNIVKDSPNEINNENILTP